MTNKTKVSLLEAEIEKLSRRNAYRSHISSLSTKLATLIAFLIQTKSDHRADREMPVTGGENGASQGF